MSEHVTPTSLARANSNSFCPKVTLTAQARTANDGDRRAELRVVEEVGGDVVVRKKLVARGCGPRGAVVARRRCHIQEECLAQLIF